MLPAKLHILHFLLPEREIKWITTTTGSATKTQNKNTRNSKDFTENGVNSLTKTIIWYTVIWNVF